jgi:MFS family permease
MDEPEPAAEQPRRWLTPGVGGVGLASFFSDAGHEVATAVLPSFLTSVLHASPGALGIIEGTSDALLGVSKIAGGTLADDPRRRATLATGGYVTTAVATSAIGLAATVWQVGVLRATAWVARGVRTPARDALLASLVPPHAYGRAFGLERAGDNLGAVVGPLMAALLVSLVGVRHAFYWALLPGLLAAGAITVAAREARRLHMDTSARRRARLNVGALREAGVARALLPVAMFEMGNIATTLLILRATELLHHGDRSLTAAASLAILLYAGHNAVATITSAAGGYWIDRSGPRAVFAAGAAVYVGAYGLFAISWHTWPPLLAAFALAGAGIGLIETAESTLVARLLPDHLRGSGFGVLGAVQSAGDFAASVVVGLLWTLVSPAVGFGYAAAWMVAALGVGWAASRARPTTTGHDGENQR